MKVVIEADGGSRGNPGPAAYGAVLKDAATGAVIAEDGTTIGVATNNVAEYSGLIAGLRLAAELAPDATVEVRMDSKLVVEQMAGRWQVKHPSMKPLVAEARALAPAGTTYTWVPRAQNSHADRLANEALDGLRSGVTIAAAEESLVEEIESPATVLAAPTTVILLRHGVTPHTTARRFSGGLGGDNPGLSDEGRTQVAEAAVWLRALRDKVAAIVASPVRRTRESAEIAAEALGLKVLEEPGFAEMEFGAWDGLTFAEVAERDKAGLDGWLGDLAVPPPGGESFRAVEARVLAGLERLLATYAGKTVLVVSHVTPIKTLVAHAMGAELSAVFAMELSPASVSVLSFYPDASAPLGRRGSLRLFNAIAPGSRNLVDNGRW
ncbi:MAG TPA: bifunctional RNase H/acid phosphatase [Nocardioides sp.]|nr:bifunctional RNase H/acid phosphatase [Nocardioides sp.]